MTNSNERSDPAEAPDTPRPDGVLRVTTGTLKVPEGLEADTSKAGDAMNRLVLFIVTGALAFIGVIAWLIYMGQ